MGAIFCTGLYEFASESVISDCRGIDLTNGPAKETTTLVDFASNVRDSRSSESATTTPGAFLLAFREVISSTTAVSLA